MPRSWAFRQGSLFPFEFGYNEGLKAEVYKPLPEKPAFYAELNDLLVKHGLEHLLGLTLNTDEIPFGTVKFEKTFDRSNVVFTIKHDNEIAAKEAIPAMWVFSGVGDFRVPFKKWVMTSYVPILHASFGGNKLPNFVVPVSMIC